MDGVRELAPLGVIQLYHLSTTGTSRPVRWATSRGPVTRSPEWLRLPGDLIFIVGGILPFIWIALLALRNFRFGKTADELPGAAAVHRDDAVAGQGGQLSAPSTSAWLVAAYAVILLAVAWGST